LAEKDNTASHKRSLRENYMRATDREGVLTKTILDSLPPEAQITIARFEGPSIAIYTKNPKFS
jgi:predicted metal-dependent RNase